jgi:phage baseplate assembly protein W
VQGGDVMPNLYPTFEVPSLVEQQRIQPAPKYGKSWFFDFEKGDFLLDGAGRVVQTDGHTAWAHYCVKTVLTERFGYLVYGPGYGCELEQARRQPSRQAVEAELERVITEALLADPRTEMVRDFSFEWQGDEVYITITAVPVVGTPERIEVKLSG